MAPITLTPSTSQDQIPEYAELHCLSNFSFLRGASHPAELVKQAAELGYRAIAITDECSLAGIVKAHVAAEKHGIKLIVGSEVFLSEGLQLVLLAPDRSAYTQLSGLITLARRRSPKGQYSLSLDDVLQYGKELLLIWLPDRNEELNSGYARQLTPFFNNNLWLGYNNSLDANNLERFQLTQTLARACGRPLVACGNVHMHSRSRKPLQDLVTSIRLNTPISELGDRLQQNTELHLHTRPELQRRYPAKLLHETLVIVRRCTFSMNELSYNYPQELVPPDKTPIQYLKELVDQGAEKRWPNGIPPKVKQLINTELSLIEDMQYEYYFLTVFDIVYFARNRNILCQGRGSAANSVVCYCLFITEVDPDRISVLFERFISKERNEPPDIDVDFEHERREEVIQYIYKKYSREHAALAATVITYRPRSAIRDVGKALGLDTLFVEQLAKSLAWWDRKGDLQKRFEEANMQGGSKMAELFLRRVDDILGFPRHLSQHVGGFIITDSPISTLVPVENAAMPERTIIQWDKEDIEAMGLLKVDVLALGMLTAIRKAFDLINSYQTVPIGMANVPAEDPITYNMLCRADSIGVFQVESRAQISMLPRLKPRTFYDLVIEVAIVRPGPIQGDMVHPYLRRREGSEAVSYPNDDVKAVLERTLGVPIFQEQVIKLAMVAAGFSGGEADGLRRAMASWGHNGSLLEFERKVIDGMLARGHDIEFARRLFNQMKGFGEYGFPESHAASFALLVYVSAWLKCHYPAAFYCALLNSQPMGFYSPSQLIQDARRHHIGVRAIDINYSNWDCSLELENTQHSVNDAKPVLRLGMRLAKGFNQAAAARVEQQRARNTFSNVKQLARLARLNRQELDALVSADALRPLSGHRHQAHWETAAVEPSAPLFADEYEEPLAPRLAAEDKQPSAPLFAAHKKLHNDLHDDTTLPAPSKVQDMLADYQSTGLSLKHHPMTLLRQQTPFSMCKKADELLQIKHGRFVRVAGVVTGKQRPGTASGVVFLTLEDETGNINIIIWKSIQERCRKALMQSRIMLIKGVLERKNSVIHVVAGDLIDQSHQLESLNSKSRDFH